MADDPRSEAEREEEERRKREGRAPLDEEIARRYDPARLSRVVARGAGRGERLDLATRSQMERLHPGHDFSGVRVFRGPLAEEVTARHGADAVTVGGTGMILVRESSRSAPGTSAGQALIAHEVTHVAQGQRGMQFALEHGGGEGAHEHEAEAVEAAVLAGDAPSMEDGRTEEREGARRRAVVERALELMHEESRLHGERNGSGWNK
jgi:hypothetical protein